MNKTISVNIAGFAFTIEEKAYDKLHHYLDSIRRKFVDEAERDEIMDDIESRIAELFQAQITTSKEVITTRDVEEVINIMGRPEDYISDEFEENEKTGSHRERFESTYEDTTQKRLFRDEDGGMVGGVCSGLGYYFNIDPTLVRIIFVILTILGGSGILIYIVLLIVVPAARSTADKLQMKGRSVNLDSIKQHFNDIKNDLTDKARRVHLKKKVKQAVDKSVHASSGFAHMISKIVGIGFIIGSLFALFVLMTIFFGETGLLPIVGSENIEDLGTFIDILYPESGLHSLILLAIIIVTTLPLISILITGIKLMFDIRKAYKPTATAGFILWVIAVAILTITGIELGMSFRSQGEINYTVPLENDSTTVLFVDISKDDIFSDHIELNQVWNYSELIKADKDQIFIGFPQLRILQKKDSTNFSITMYKRSNGLSVKEAIDKAEKTQYDLQLKNDHLLLPAYYSFPAKDKLRGQGVVVEIKVPLGKRLEFGNNIDRIGICVDGDNYDCRHPEQHYSNTSWHSEGTGMICSGCEHIQRVYHPHSD